MHTILGNDQGVRLLKHVRYLERIRYFMFFSDVSDKLFNYLLYVIIIYLKYIVVSRKNT